MKNKLLITLVMVGFLTFSGAEARACDKGKSKCMKCAMNAKQCKMTKLKKKVKMLWTNKEDLNISDNQMDQIKDIKHAALKEMIQLKADKEILMIDLKSAMWEEQIDLDAVNSMIGQKYETKKKTALAFVKAISDIQGILNEKQRAQWKDLAIAAKLAGCSSCSGQKICPLTGKAIKGSPKGSMSK